MLTILLFGCAPEPEEEVVCADFPTSATEAPTVLENDDSCGHWSVPLGDQLVVSLIITEPEAPCELASDEGLTLLYDPIYTNMSNDSPKWTFQVGADVEAEGVPLEISCEEGTTWAALVDVVAG
jgi:hypothetical protein